MRRRRRSASRGCTASRGRSRGIALLAALGAAGCLPAGGPAPRSDAEPPRVRVHTLPQPDPGGERYCAWYGEARDGVLYFGQAAFWSSYRTAGGDPTADLAEAGPRPIGRFDLELRQPLEPLETGPRADGTPARTGVWDVLPLRGRVYFTSLFDGAGYVDLATGRRTLFPDSALWNEIAVGPVVSNREGFSTTSTETLLFSRYADRDQGGGAVLVTDLDGQVLRELPVGSPEEDALAAKTPAWDPVTRTVWVTSDRLPRPPPGEEPGPDAHPTIVMDLYGDELQRYPSADQPLEVQFVRFDLQGLGFAAFVRDGRLELGVLAPSDSRRRLAAARTAILDERFARAFDFAQDIHIGPDGSGWVTQWSGAVHRVTPRTGAVQSWVLPRPDGALYYSAVPAGPTGALCATRCGDVDVVCASPAAPQAR